MNLSSIFIKRPVMTTLIMAGILIFGALAYQNLPVSDLPAVDYPTISVNANLPGASPETMSSTVATPLEKQFSTISGLTSMSSTSSTGKTRITLQFDLSRNIDAAAQDVQSSIASSLGRLPQDMPNPPTYRKANPASAPVLMLVLTTKTLPLYTLADYGSNMMAQQISMVNGVAQVLVFGDQKYAVRIQLNPETLNSRGLGLNEVSSAVQAANSNRPTGSLEARHWSYTLKTSGQIENAEEFGRVIVAYRNGRPVRLSELGDVLDSVETDKEAAWFNNERSIVLAIQRQPGTNTVEVVDAVQKLLPKFEASLPASISMNVLFDRSKSIRESVVDVKFTLLFTLCLVVLVIFVFLRRVTATIIPSLAMPMSIVGTFSVMYFMDYSLDNLSVMALILAMGFVVDDAIVMLENIIRHMEMGESPLEAAFSGSKEVSFTILSMTLSLAAVFLPVLFMGGVIGRLFHEFAVTIAAAVLVSGMVSLTLTPMLCRLLLKENHRSKEADHVPTGSGGFYTLILRMYSASLRFFLRHRPTVMVFSALVLVGTFYLFWTIPKGFVPSQDNDQLMGYTQAKEGISFQSMMAHQQEAAKIVAADPNIAAFMSSVGTGGPSGSGNSGQFFIRLKPRKERTLSADQVAAELRPKLAQIPGLRTFIQNPPVINVGGQFTRSMYQLTLQGSNTDELYRLAPELAAKIGTLPGLLDVNTDLQINTPQVRVDIDRDKAATLGITPDAIENALYTAYGSRQISTILTPTDEYAVIMELQPKFELNPASISLLKIRSSNGKLVSMDSVATLKQTVGPAQINHLGQAPSVTISFNLLPGISLGDAVNLITPLAKQTLPASISTSFQGAAQAFQSSMSGMGLLLLMAILVIYLVLGILYESFIHPITILSALPFAGFGALITLVIFNVELNIYGFIGIIMLIGLVKKNGIMMIDFAIENRKNSDVTSTMAIYEACVVRFRPIMMTTMAALMGTLPIALGYGAGGEARQPLGLAVVGGLLFSQFLTLYVTPVFYTYMEDLQALLTRSKKKVPEVEAPATS